MSDFNYEIERTDHYSLVNAILYGESVQDGTPTPDAPVDVQVVGGRNLMPNDAATSTINGLTFTVNPDGSVTVTGTATAGTAYNYLSTNASNFTLSAGSYVLSGCPAGGSGSKWKLDINDTNDTYTNDYGSGGTFTVSSTRTIRRCRIVVYSGQTVDFTFKPQLEAGTTATPYMPYGSIGIVIDSTATPIDLQGNVLASLPDGTRDTVTVDSAGHVVLEKRVNHKVFDGSETWTTYTFAHGPGFYSSSIDDMISAASVMVDKAICSAFTIKSSNNTTYDGNMYFDNSKSPCCINSNYTDVNDFKAWLAANPVHLYYECVLQTIDLGYIDLSYLQDIPDEIPISFVSTLTPDSTYLYENIPSYEVKNPYEDYNAPEYAYPPNHFGQEWETFDANDWNVSEMLDYTGQFESHAVYSIELCELMQSGTFNWSRPELDWNEAAYDTEQYERFCKYFEQRFMFREISMLPPLQWFTALKRMLVYELMPKYKPLYAQVENGISPLGENEYYKERHVSSSYPETLLSGNSDYISSGEDREFERIKVDNAAEALEAYRNGFRSVDAALGDELEILFISMYTSFVNAF